MSTSLTRLTTAGSVKPSGVTSGAVLKNSAGGGRVRASAGLGVVLAVGPGRAGAKRLHPERRRCEEIGAVSAASAASTPPPSIRRLRSTCSQARGTLQGFGVEVALRLGSVGGARVRIHDRSEDLGSRGSTSVHSTSLRPAPSGEVFLLCRAFLLRAWRCSISFSDRPAAGARQVHPSPARSPLCSRPRGISTGVTPGGSFSTIVSGCFGGRCDRRRAAVDRDQLVVDRVVVAGRGDFGFAFRFFRLHGCRRLFLLPFQILSSSWEVISPLRPKGLLRRGSARRGAPVNSIV